MIVAKVMGMYLLSCDIVEYAMIDDGNLDEIIGMLEDRGFTLLRVKYEVMV